MTEIKKDRELSEKQLANVVGGRQDRNARVGDRIKALRKRSNDATLGTPDVDKKKPRTGLDSAR